MAAGGIHLFGKNHVVDSCHVLNAGGVYMYFHSTGAIIRNTVIEHFASDAMNIKASNVRVENCIIVDSHKVNGNHNDMCQGWASANVVFRGNRLVAYRGVPNAFTARDVQGLGAYDGWKTRWQVTDNLVATDHPIGIWIQGDEQCRVSNNTVVRCGRDLFFKSSPTSILVGPAKDGSIRGGSIVANNLAEAYRLTGSRSIGGANVVATFARAATNFATPFTDVHLLPGAQGRGAGNFTLLPSPSYDQDGVLRAPGQPVDAGCLQFRGGYQPQRPSSPLPAVAIVVPNVGYDVSWVPLVPAPSRSIEILGPGGARVGLTRAARSCFMVVDPSVPVGPAPTGFRVRYIPDLEP